jgi:Flp pilus assembly protein TadD
MANFRSDSSRPSGVSCDIKAKLPARVLKPASGSMARAACVALCFLGLWICLAQPARAQVENALMTIYVEDNSGRRLATGNGVLLSSDGLVVTDMQPVLAWLESDRNSLVVRAGDRGYFPIDTLLSIDRERGVALFKIDVRGIAIPELAVEHVPAKDEEISLIGSPDGLKTERAWGFIKGPPSDGMFGISVPVQPNFRGGPVIDAEGKIMGIALFQGGENVALTIRSVLNLAGRKPEEHAPADVTSQMARIKKAKTIEESRATAEDYFRLGMAYNTAGMAEKAAEAFGKAVKLKPDFAVAYHGLGVSYAKAGRYEEAVEALKRAVEIKPDLAEAYGNLGFLYDHLGRPEEAAEAFREALRLKPDYAEAYNGLGVVLAREKKYEESIGLFKQALRIRPELKKARFNLALSYISLEDVESALSQERLLREIDPELADRLLDFLNMGGSEEEPEGLGEGSIENTPISNAPQ